MASPTNIRLKWPSENKMSVKDVADFVPYVSNLVNAFRRAPRPMAPKLVDPISTTPISLDNARAEVSNATRAADLSTVNLDAQTGAAIRVGNLAARMRSLSDIASREAMLNAQNRNQTASINANIDAMNTGITNQYRDDLVNARIAQQREQSENLADAADKFIYQQTQKDLTNLENQKATTLSRMYDRGLYGRLTKGLQQAGVTVPGTDVETPSPFEKYKSFATTPLTGRSQLTTEMPETITLPAATIDRMRRFMEQRKTYAAGGMMKRMIKPFC